MEFKIYYHDIFEKHLVPIGHPERPDRIINLNKLIKNLFPNQIQKIKSQKVIKNILKVHTKEYIKNLFSLKPENDILQIDADTYISLNSLKAAETAVCGIIQAVDFVMKTNNSKSDKLSCVGNLALKLVRLPRKSCSPIPLNASSAVKQSEPLVPSRGHGEPSEHVTAPCRRSPSPLHFWRQQPEFLGRAQLVRGHRPWHQQPSATLARLIVQSDPLAV